MAALRVRVCGYRTLYPFILTVCPLMQRLARLLNTARCVVSNPQYLKRPIQCPIGQAYHWNLQRDNGLVNKLAARPQCWTW